MTQSILVSVKKVMGITSADESFDLDLTMHINAIFSTLHQIGIGPEEGYQIEDASDMWEDFLGVDPRLNFVKTYVYLRVRLIFDPLQNPSVIESMNKQIQELESRMSILREGDSWQDPFVPAAPTY